ncbi:MspA family porin [Mycolicibacterium fortuitum]|uniref:MspA family porin n=1 Tax=Mycolicibacterium fortuitum TaxID=1766 RepID=UPI0007EA76F9|nr:MspA family porin [Mycolicibacterium fortuitum]MBP3087218.1 MspA family porin [Mycolicibacterium fortuitum]MCA4726381.1 MspA family porin [Mycolicibacterium fortuitum]MCA4756473.1 MspA family porin [Mycolicibacterium fortuitum]NOQ61604.1 MspA family porin [Mycolicibacterium fortuitum]OBB22050.1 MspA protein [Mycolicibacterium fortuitum]
MLIRSFGLLVAASLVCAAPVAPAWADPVVAPEVEVVADIMPKPGEPAVADLVESTPPANLKTPDGWNLTVSAGDETQAAVAPLTTAVSSREYVVGGTYRGAMAGPDSGEDPRGTLEAGYQIGCGIDMSTSNGVALTGTAGLNSSIGVLGTDVVSPWPEGILPGVGANIGGGITVGLKPGIINLIPVVEKEFKGTEPWVMISNFRVKIDGCVGQSFIRSYAVLTRSTDESEAVLAWYGTTKVV